MPRATNLFGVPLAQLALGSSCSQCRLSRLTVWADRAILATGRGSGEAASLKGGHRDECTELSSTIRDGRCDRNADGDGGRLAGVSVTAVRAGVGLDRRADPSQLVAVFRQRHCGHSDAVPMRHGASPTGLRLAERRRCATRSRTDSGAIKPTRSDRSSSTLVDRVVLASTSRSSSDRTPNSSGDLRYATASTLSGSIRGASVGVPRCAASVTCASRPRRSLRSHSR